MTAAGAGNLERALKLIDCAYEIGDAARRGGDNADKQILPMLRR